MKQRPQRIFTTRIEIDTSLALYLAFVGLRCISRGQLSQTGFLRNIPLCCLASLRWFPHYYPVVFSFGVLISTLYWSDVWSLACLQGNGRWVICVLSCWIHTKGGSWFFLGVLCRGGSRAALKLGIVVPCSRRSFGMWYGLGSLEGFEMK